MKLTLDVRSKNLIQGYSPGEVRVSNQVIKHNCLISADQLIGWEVAKPLTINDVQPILALKPEVVVLGQERSQRLPSADIYAAFLESGIGFEVMDIGAACRTFNILLGEDRRVIAALVLAA